MLPAVQVAGSVLLPVEVLQACQLLLRGLGCAQMLQLQHSFPLARMVLQQQHSWLPGSGLAPVLCVGGQGRVSWVGLGVLFGALWVWLLLLLLLVRGCVAAALRSCCACARAAAVGLQL
jgi:hypothetical protein